MPVWENDGEQDAQSRRMCHIQERTGCVRGGDDDFLFDERGIIYGRLESSEKKIAILGDRWLPQTAKQDEIG